MKMKKILLGLFVIAGISSIYAQDPIFTQFYANPLYLNPALAGTNICPRYLMNHRNQWPSLSGNFVTNSFSYDQYFDAINGGFGLLAMHDMQGQGTIQEVNLAAIYSYHLKVTRKFTLLFAGQAMYGQKFLDWDKLTFGDMIDPRRGFIYQTGDVRRGGSKGYFDVSAGIGGFTKNFYFGAAVHHLNRPNISMIVGNSPLPMRFTGHAGFDIPLGGKSMYRNPVSLSPNIVYRYQQGFMEMNIGAYMKYDMFTFGTWFRSRDAFILTLGLSTNTFRLGYSYDLTVSRLTNQSGGSHEVSMGFYVKCKKKSKKFRTIACPSF
jgi:type IX secretion system PorP/SprF family membrane protein